MEFNRDVSEKSPNEKSPKFDELLSRVVQMAKETHAKMDQTTEKLKKDETLGGLYSLVTDTARARMAIALVGSDNMDTFDTKTMEYLNNNFGEVIEDLEKEFKSRKKAADFLTCTIEIVLRKDELDIFTQELADQYKSFKQFIERIQKCK